jgi:hypothetical protein
MSGNSFEDTVTHSITIVLLVVLVASADVAVDAMVSGLGVWASIDIATSGMHSKL